MFGHYPFILKQHVVSMESALRNHTVTTQITAPILANMYALAQSGLRDPVQADGFFTSSLRSGNITLSSVTEAKTGIYVQLAQVAGSTGSGTFLTIGQKWVMDQANATGHTATCYWS